MEGKIIKGRKMSETMKRIVSDTIGSYSIDQDYFFVYADIGLLIYEVKNEN